MHMHMCSHPAHAHTQTHTDKHACTKYVHMYLQKHTYIHTYTNTQAEAHTCTNMLMHKQAHAYSNNTKKTFFGVRGNTGCFFIQYTIF